MCVRHRLRDEERPAQVGVENEIPVVPGDLGGALADVAAGVVDQDVDLAERVCAASAIARMLASLRTSSSSGHDPPAQRRDFLLERAQRVERAAGDREIGAGPGQRTAED